METRKGTPRHKCCVCGRVRYEKSNFKSSEDCMLRLKNGHRFVYTRYGKQIWYCNEFSCREAVKKDPGRYEY